MGAKGLGRSPASQVILYCSSSLTKKYRISQVTIFVKGQNYVLSRTSSEFFFFQKKSLCYTRISSY